MTHRLTIYRSAIALLAISLTGSLLTLALLCNSDGLTDAPRFQPTAAAGSLG